MIVAHPQNIELLKKLIPSLRPVFSRLYGEELVADSFMPLEKPTGLIILPDGSRISEEEFEMHDGFTLWEKQDLHYLLMVGVVRREMGSVFYQIKRDMIDTFRSGFLSLTA